MRIKKKVYFYQVLRIDNRNCFYHLNLGNSPSYSVLKKKIYLSSDGHKETPGTLLGGEEEGASKGGTRPTAQSSRKKKFRLGWGAKNETAEDQEATVEEPEEEKGGDHSVQLWDLGHRIDFGPAIFQVAGAMLPKSLLWAQSFVGSKANPLIGCRTLRRIQSHASLRSPLAALILLNVRRQAEEALKKVVPNLTQFITTIEYQLSNRYPGNALILLSNVKSQNVSTLGTQTSKRFEIVCRALERCQREGSEAGYLLWQAGQYGFLDFRYSEARQFFNQARRCESGPFLSKFLMAVCEAACEAVSEEGCTFVRAQTLLADARKEVWLESERDVLQRVQSYQATGDDKLCSLWLLAFELNYVYWGKLTQDYDMAKHEEALGLIDSMAKKVWMTACGTKNGLMENLFYKVRPQPW